MAGFLTVEDIDGTLFREQSFYLHTFDTSLISEDSNFTDVKYDFCEISRETITGGYKFTFKVENPYWTKGYYMKNKYVGQGSYISSFINSSGHLIIETTSKAIIVKLYMGVLQITSQNKEIFKSLENEVLNLNLKELNTTQTIKLIDIAVPTLVSSVSKDLNKGYNLIEQYGLPVGYLLVNLIKSDFQFNCNQELTVGKINKVNLGTATDYKPSGDMVGSYTPNITVNYKGDILPVTYNGTDYVFDLDLTDITEAGKVRFTVNVEANEVLNQSSTEVVLTSQYQTVNTFNALLSAVTNSDVIRLGANMTATSDIPINRSLKIIGNDKSIDLDGHRFNLKEEVEFKAENIVFDNGDTTIIQAKNTKVELNNVTFNNCTSSNYNGLGSCIFCDVDVDSLDVTNDYITTLTECTFTDNANCILHGGELTVIGCTLENDDITNINTNNVAFLYQTDGTALIQQSVFTIDYDYTSQEANIGFAQAVVMCGETAIINGATYIELGNDNTLPFFEAPFHNRADLTAKYYYPQITANVESIGTIEHKACTHAVSGVDWVFKNNVTVRRLE